MLFLIFLGAGTGGLLAQGFDPQDLVKAKGLIIFLPERGVSAKLQLFQEAKPPRGIIRPYLMGDGTLFEIEDGLILETIGLHSLLPETLIKNQELLLSKAKEQLNVLMEKYPRFSREWEAIAKAQEKEKTLASQGYIKQKAKWFSAAEWSLLQKAQAGPDEKPLTRLVTKDGKTYQNAKLSRIDGTTLIITHESGIAKIPKTGLPAVITPPDQKIEEAIAKIMAIEEVPAPTPLPTPTPVPPAEKGAAPEGT